MPREYRHSYSRSPRRSRSRSPGDRYKNDYRDDRRSKGGSSSNYRDRGGSDRYRDRSNDRRSSEIDQCRVHIADLTDSVTQYDIEKAFMKFGEIKEVWMAKNPPCFAFVVYKNKEDAAIAVKDMDGKTIGYNRVRVTFARPRTRGRRRRWDPNMRCYQCGERGHFSRDCDRDRRRYDRSYSRGRNNRRTRTRSRSRSRSYSRSRTPRRDNYRNTNVNGSNGGGVNDGVN